MCKVETWGVITSSNYTQFLRIKIKFAIPITSSSAVTKTSLYDGRDYIRLHCGESNCEMLNSNEKIILSYIKNILPQFPALILMYLSENNYSCPLSSVDILIRLQTRQSEELCFNCRQEQKLILFVKILTVFHSEQGALSPRIKLPVREVYDTPSCTDEVKNRHSFYFRPPICLRSIHMGDFTFNFSAVGMCQLN
jgi:hypothetical protein